MKTLYDLILLLDADAPSERRQQIMQDVEAAVSAGGSIESNHDWGVRRLSYEIDHRTEAEYHLIQFSGPPELLESLQRTLKITDGIIRFRIIRVRPGTPPPPAPRAEPVTAEAPSARAEAPPRAPESTEAPPAG
jgi:small subunit ribosomal protein S6